MPKRKDIKSILIVGAGPIIIGQACEFDYSGTQACKALREEGYRVILINSNPATIMTDPDTADVVYIEPITPEIVAKIIKKVARYFLNLKFNIILLSYFYLDLEFQYQSQMLAHNPNIYRMPMLHL